MLYYQNELYHHGIIGMKWGIRRYQPYPKNSSRKGKEVGQAAKVQQRSDRIQSTTAKRFTRLDTKIAKKQNKANKMYAKAEKKSISLLATQKGIDRAFGKATVSQRKVNNLQYKGGQYYKRAVKKLSRMDISMNSDLAERGQKYLDAVRKNTEELYKLSLYK